MSTNINIDDQDDYFSTVKKINTNSSESKNLKEIVQFKEFTITPEEGKEKKIRVKVINNSKIKKTPEILYVDTNTYSQYFNY